MCRTEISRDHELEISKFISWKEVGPYLPRITNVDIKDLHENFNEAADKRKRLVQIWKEKNAADATYHVLIIAMRRAEKEMEALHVCRLLCPHKGVAK